MKIAKIAVAALMVLALLAVAPVAAMAASWNFELFNDGANAEFIRIEGPDRVAPGSTGTYTLWASGISQGEVLPEGNYSESEFAPNLIWDFITPRASGTSISNVQGFGVLTVAPDETATSLTIRVSTSASNPVQMIFEVFVGTAPAPAGNGAESEFWYGVHAQMVPLNNGGSLTVETANEDGHIPYFIFQLMLDTDLTLTVHRGFDTFVLTSAFVKEFNPYGQSLSFTHSLAAMLTPTANDNGGFTYR